MPHSGNRKLKIGIDATLGAGSGAGGIESVLHAFVAALAGLDEGTEEYLLITSPESAHWLDRVRGKNQRVVIRPSAPRRLGILTAAREMVRKRRPRLNRPPPTPSWPQVTISDGYIESLGCDVMHFPTQSFTLCATPFIYHPHDLQHRHFPEFFRASDLAWRDVQYRAGCNFARKVAVASDWVARDLEREFGIHPSKIQVIPWAAPTQSVIPLDATARLNTLRKHQLPQPFAFFPAMLWRHKNHERLLEAVALLRQRDGLTLNLVCTGAKHDPRWHELQAKVGELGLHACVRFVGNVDAREIRALYAESSFVVIPTLFEAASAPMFEAWLEQKPVTCSTVTSLPEQAGGAALLFDAESVEQIAGALKRMVTEPALRASLASAGRRRLEDFDWTRSARAFRALYRRVARIQLTTEDERLLAWNWMRDPTADGLPP